MPMRAQRSGGGRAGHETRSNSTIASCINPTLPTMLVVLMHVCMYARTPKIHNPTISKARRVVAEILSGAFSGRMKVVHRIGKQVMLERQR